MIPTLNIPDENAVDFLFDLNEQVLALATRITKAIHTQLQLDKHWDRAHVTDPQSDSLIRLQDAREQQIGYDIVRLNKAVTQIA